jgi:transposase
MAALRGWAPCGTRLTAKVPHGHWKTTTFLAALRYDRIEAPWVLDGPIDGESFAIYVEKVLLPTLQVGDIVIMDNLGSHKGKAVRALIRSRGAKLFFLPKYSPDLNPIEQVSPSSSTCCEKLPREPSRPSGQQSVSCFQPSCQRNAPTTSKTRDTPQPKFIPL